VVFGVVTALVAAIGIGVLAYRSMSQGHLTHRPRFPA
jgi:hypothetical protein